MGGVSITPFILYLCFPSSATTFRFFAALLSCWPISSFDYSSHRMSHGFISRRQGATQPHDGSLLVHQVTDAVTSHNRLWKHWCVGHRLWCGLRSYQWSFSNLSHLMCHGSWNLNFDFGVLVLFSQTVAPAISASRTVQSEDRLFLASSEDYSLWTDKATLGSLSLVPCLIWKAPFPLSSSQTLSCGHAKCAGGNAQGPGFIKLFDSYVLCISLCWACARLWHICCNRKCLKLLSFLAANFPAYFPNHHLYHLHKVLQWLLICTSFHYLDCWDTHAFRNIKFLRLGYGPHLGMPYGTVPFLNKTIN